MRLTRTYKGWINAISSRGQPHDMRGQCVFTLNRNFINTADDVHLTFREDMPHFSICHFIDCCPGEVFRNIMYCYCK